MRISTRLTLLVISVIIINCLSKAHTNELPMKTYEKFLIDYFTERRIENAVMFLCWSRLERIQMLQAFSRANIVVTVPRMRNVISHRDSERIMSLHDLNLIGVVVDLCCFDERAPFIQRPSYFNSSYAWVFFDSCGATTASEGPLSILRNLSLAMHSDVVLAASSGSSGLVLLDAFHTGANKGGRFVAKEVGAWTGNDDDDDDGGDRPSSSWRRHWREPVARRRPRMDGVVMRTVTLMENNREGRDPQEYLGDERWPHVDTVFRMNYQFVAVLRDMFNFTIKFVLANNWSDRNSKGVYRSGNLLGLFADGKGDIMAGALLLREDRVEIADVLYMTYPLRCGFIFRYQGDFGESQTSFYSPFHKYVWYCFLTIIGVVVAIAWSILLFENKFIDVVNKTLWNLSDTVLSVVGACCQMGTEITPITSASRLVYFIFFFSCLVIYNFYTSSIVSSLLNIRAMKFTVVDLANSPLKCGSFDVGYVHNLLFDIPMYPNMAYFNKKKKTANFYFPIEEGVRLVKKGGFAYHSEFNSIYKTIENMLEPTEICELQEADTIPRNMMGILAAKYSQYSEMLKVGMNRIAETGQLHRQVNKWLIKKPACQSNMIFKEVSFSQIMSSHFLLLIGVAVAFTIMLLERKKRGFLTCRMTNKK